MSTRIGSETRTFKYRVIALDVWGHGPTEHEEVEARERIYNEGTPHESRAFSVEAQTLISRLVEGGFLGNALNASNVKLDGEDDGMLYLEREEDGLPLIHLEYQGADDGR
jgi:hypothetical protein